MRELELNGGITIVFIAAIITLIITVIITFININELCLGQAKNRATNLFCTLNDLGNKLE